jgi:hypothetical protein
MDGDQDEQKRRYRSDDPANPMAPGGGRGWVLDFAHIDSALISTPTNYEDLPKMVRLECPAKGFPAIRPASIEAARTKMRRKCEACTAVFWVEARSNVFVTH